MSPYVIDYFTESTLICTAVSSIHWIHLLVGGLWFWNAWGGFCSANILPWHLIYNKFWCWTAWV